MSRRLRLIAVCAGLLASAGCSGPPSPGPLPPFLPPGPGLEPPSTPQRLAALALFDAAFVHAQVTTSVLRGVSDDGQVWSVDGPCVDGSGSLQRSLDGGVPPTPGAFLPTGSHTYVVSFDDCQIDEWPWESRLNGVVSAAYNIGDWSNITATVSADSVRGQRLATAWQGSRIVSELRDVTADGSAGWTSVRGVLPRSTYTPATGSRLVNNSTTNVATFGGGSYSSILHPPPQGRRSRGEQRFDNLKVAINGTEYILNGSLDTTYDFSDRVSYTGEIQVINNGTLVARIYGTGNDRVIEVLIPLVAL